MITKNMDRTGGDVFKDRLLEYTLEARGEHQKSQMQKYLLRTSFPVRHKFDFAGKL